MAAKKKQALQTHIHSNDEWDELLATQGLKVVDVYSEWCGQCVALKQTLRKVKLDLSDDLLHFATANADKVEALKRYAGTSRPTFLIYGGDVLVDLHRGVDGPALEQSIKKHIQLEHDAIESGKERVPFEDVEGEKIVAAREASARAVSARKKSAHPGKSFTFAMIKPGAVAEGFADDIFAGIAEAGFKVTAQDETQLTPERAAEFYGEHKGKEFFDNLVEQMSSGPIRTLVLAKSGSDAVAAWRSFIGPTNPEKAKEEAPDSLRAKFGTDVTQNAVHGSDSDASAAREIYFFFGDWATENLATSQAVATVASSAAEKVPDVVAFFEKAGFTVQSKELHAAPAGHEEAAKPEGEGEEAPTEQKAEADEQPASGGTVLLLTRVAAVRGAVDLLGSPEDNEESGSLCGLFGDAVSVTASAEEAAEKVAEHFPEAVVEDEEEEEEEEEDKAKEVQAPAPAAEGSEGKKAEEGDQGEQGETAAAETEQDAAPATEDGEGAAATEEAAGTDAGESKPEEAAAEPGAEAAAETAEPPATDAKPEQTKAAEAPKPEEDKPAAE